MAMSERGEALALELAEERQYCAKLAERVQQQARELQQKHAELKELVEYKVLCERRILELQPKHTLPVRREQLGADEAPADGDAPPGGQPVVDSHLPTHMLSTLAQRRREYEDLLSRYRALESTGKKTHDKLAEANRALRDLRGAMESREKDHQAAQRKIESLSKKLAVVERHSKANEDYVNKMQRKFATGSQGTHMLRKNAILQKRLEEAEAEKKQLALQLRNEAEEEVNRQEYVAHLRKALDMKATDFGLKPGQSDVLQELARLRSSYRSTLQEVASYEDRCAAQEQTINTLREQISDLRREETALQGQLNDTLSRSRTVASERSNAHSQLDQLRAKLDALSAEKTQLNAVVDMHVERHERAEASLQTCREQLEESARQLSEVPLLRRRNAELEVEIDRLKESIGPLEAQVMGQRLEIDELSQHLQAKADEVTDLTKLQAELLSAAQEAKVERKQLQSELHDSAQARTADAKTIAQFKSERDEVSLQLRTKDEELQQHVAELARIRRRLEAKSSELDSRATMASYIDGKFKAIADIVHRHPGCSIGAGTQDVCKRIIKLEQEARALKDLFASEDDDVNDSDHAASDVETSAARHHKVASQLESLVASCGALSRQSTQLVADADDDRDKMAADAERRILEAETAAREAAEEAEQKVREADSRFRSAEDQAASLGRQVTQLEGELTSLRGQLSQMRVEEAMVSKLQSENQNIQQLFSSKSKLLEKKADSAIKDKKEADKRVTELKKQLDELSRVLKDQEATANREREMLETNASDAATKSAKLESRIRDMEDEIRRHGKLAESMESQLADRQAEQTELANSRSEIDRLKHEVSQTRVLLKDAQEQIERMHRRQGPVEHESPSAYRGGSDMGGGGLIGDDTGTGRRQSMAAAAGLSVITSPVGSERQQSHTVAASPSAKNRDAGTAATPNQQSATGGTPAEMLFSALDADGDGVITRQEMADGLSGMARGSSSNNRTPREFPSADERSVLRGGAVGDSPAQWRSGQNARDFIAARSSPSSEAGGRPQQAHSFAGSSELDGGRAVSPSGASYSSRSSRGREGEELLMQKLSEITAENQAMASEIQSETSSP